MSTYSWSYKNAPHRQPAVKKTEAGDETAGDLPRSNTNEKQSQPTALNHFETGKTKRLNWKAKIYVGNLNKKTNEASLAYYFSVFGDIDDVKLIRDHSTNESRGFAFITFEKVESAEKAKKWCAFNYPTLDDNSITVARAERKLAKTKAVPFKEYAAPRDPLQTLFWEYKWKNEPDAQVYGPYETSLMLAWKNQGYFDSGCWVRQVLHSVRSVEDKRQLDDEEESEPSSQKKPKLVIDYSDSDNEEGWETENKREEGGERKKGEQMGKEVGEGTGKSEAGQTAEREIAEKQTEGKQEHEGEEETEWGKSDAGEKNRRLETESELGNEEENEDNEKEYGTSDDEYPQDSTGYLSTEFVAISEIDFDFFP